MLVGKEIGPFYIERELGSGAMGTVYRALNRGTGERVALKIIAEILLSNETAVKRFEREAGILKKLKHPNIVRLIGTGSYKKKTPFFIMEYVEGESLDRILERRSSLEVRATNRDRDGRMSWEQVVLLGQQLCDALQHAHQKGIFHRDLKPSNLMVLQDGTVKLTDFGIAKDVDVTALTNANVTVGTAAYMSPEQCKGEKNLSHKSDLYSLGVVFFELLTGRKPFNKDNPIDMFQAHVFEKPERPSRLVPDIPVWLDTLVVQLMEKKPEHRPLDAAMVRKVLDEVENKVVGQHSAGVDAATARSVDRVPNPTPADAADRDAARALRGGMARKKVKKKGVPLLDRPWVKAVGLLTALVAIGGFMVYMTRPPTAEALYARVKSAVADKDQERLFEQAQRYFDLYGARDDERTREVRAWWEAGWVEKRELQLHNRFVKQYKADDPGQKIALEALKRENEGDVEEARKLWTDLDAEFKENRDPDQRAYSLVARKKLRDLAELPRRRQRLQEDIGKLRIGQKPEHSADEPVERKMLEAVRFEDFGDLPAARDKFKHFFEDKSKELEPRPWVVFAAWRGSELKAQAVTGQDKERDFRRDLLTQRLAQIQQVAPTADPFERRQAEKVARDLADLYKADPVPEFKQIADQAQRKLQDLVR